jgi:hypothetical protein
MNRYIFWDITPFSPLKVNHFSVEHVASETLIDFQNEYTALYVFHSM